MAKNRRLSDRFLQNLPPGRLEWIGLRPARNEAMVTVDSAQAVETLGLEGDRRCQSSPGSARQVTLIQIEHIALIAQLLASGAINPALLRRNLVVSGINLLALRHQRFRIGEAVFEGTATCAPCSRMETALGPGGFAAMLGHGGLCAKIVTGGQLTVGDPVIKLDD